jgi:hypothetical protein
MRLGDLVILVFGLAVEDDFILETIITGETAY